MSIADLRIVKAERLTDSYIAAGDCAYLIGAQDGSFPDLGWHVPGEMGGLWAHPIKLLDGFWLRIGNEWLTQATRFISGPFWNEHHYELEGLQVVRRQFVPDGEQAIVLRYTFRSAERRSLDLRFLARTDLQGVWLSENEGFRQGWDHARYDSALDAWVGHDDLNPWFVVLGARGLRSSGRESGRDLWGPERTQGQGISVALDYQLALPAGGEAAIEFVIAGSSTRAAEAKATFQLVAAGADGLWTLKEQRYAAMLARSALSLPELTIQRTWDWVKCNYDWLVREVEGIGRGLGAGAPDYPWFFGCDSTYALYGNLVLGQHQTAIETLDLLRALSLAWNGETGQVIHEATTRGFVFNPGNVQETPHFVMAVWQTYLWTGDRSFLGRNYEFCKKGILDWLLATRCLPGDPLPYGYGIMEVEGLNLQAIDVATYTVEALAALAQMAELCGEPEVGAHCRQQRDEVHAALAASFWMEAEGLYGEIIATPAEIAPRLRALIDQAERSEYRDISRPEVVEGYARLLTEAESDPEQERKRPWLLRNWTVITPLEAGLATPEQAARTLDRMATPEFLGLWGIYLNGIERSQMMSINTGVVAVAAARYGRPQQALALIRQLCATLELQMPGAIAEVSPDQGCFVQAWSGYGIAWTIVAQIFGLRPDAHRRLLVLQPHFPAEWPSATLQAVQIGDTQFDLHWDGEVLTVTADRPGWRIEAHGVQARLAPISM